MSNASSALLLVLALGLRSALAATLPVVSIITDSAPGEPAKHGASALRTALGEKGLSFEETNSLDAAQGGVLIVAGLARGDGPAATLLGQLHQAVPTNAEALAIRRLSYQGKTVWVLGGSDDAGLMYAELDLADRIGWSTNGESLLAELRETVEKPDTRRRAIALYTMNRAYWESRFYDEAYWRRYLDTLARDRFNAMVVVFGYENGGFLAPCYPYFFDTPEFPEVKMIGITPGQQGRNTGALNRLIAMAHARGISLSVGLWDHIYRGGVQNGGTPGGDDGLRRPTPGLVWGMNAANLIPYTQTALKRFLRQFPGLDGIQFRMHDESGLKPAEQGDFWKAVFQTIMETAPKLPLDLRAKGLTPSELQSALDSGVNFHLSTKYWMEQMGLPFHPAHINPRDQKSARHSYAGLLVYPKKYQMSWQLWNGGTSRVFLWGDPEYARRFVESARLYDGDSFEVQEPLATKMEGQPHDAKPFDLIKPSARYYDYEFERYWYFFRVFGRSGYSTDTPVIVWHRDFEKRFGSETGLSLEKALRRASWILPRIIASSYPYGGFPMTAGWAEKQRLGDLPQFAQASLSDPQLFESFDEEAKLLLEGGETAKTRPQETSHWFAEAAAEILARIDMAELTIGSFRGKEFDSTILDLKMLANLALYHSRRIPAAVSHRLYERTKDPAALDDAITYERSATTAWRQMVEAAGDTYAGDLMFGARSRGLSGHWRDDLVSLEKGLSTLERERSRIPANAGAVTKASPRYEPFDTENQASFVLHQPVTMVPAGRPLTIAARVTSLAGIKWVQVLYRRVDQTKDYETLEMRPVNDRGDYQAVIPAGQIDPRYDFMYFIQVMDNNRRGVMYPDFNQQTPYFVARVER